MGGDALVLRQSSAHLLSHHASASSFAAAGNSLPWTCHDRFSTPIPPGHARLYVSRLYVSHSSHAASDCPDFAALTPTAFPTQRPRLLADSPRLTSSCAPYPRPYTVLTSVRSPPVYPSHILSKLDPACSALGWKYLLLVCLNCPSRYWFRLISRP
jgi:hypothetical protein